MEIKIEGNPGTGNTYQEINIQHVDNFNPNATTVNNNYYGTREERTAATNANPKNSHDDVRELSVIREEILKYVSRVSGQVADEWKSRYMKMWGEILDLQAIADKVYDPGKQQETNFNRDLVANIIFYLVKQGCYGDEKKYNASLFTVMLGHEKEDSVRASLRNMPPDEITSRLNRYFE